MKAICAVCGRGYEVSAAGPLGSCVSCGGQLKGVMGAPPVINDPSVAGTAPVAEAFAGTIELAGESLAAGITCPNCGKWIEAGAQICTACGYSRRLARTLTTRVGTPELPKPKSKGTPGSSPAAPEIEAERAHRRARARGRGGRADAIRVFVSAMWLLALGALVMAAATKWLEQNVPVKLPGLLLPPKFDGLNASFLMLMFLGVALPITALGVRIAAAVTAIEISTYFSWLRTAGVLAAVLVTMEIGFTVDQMILHLETRWLIAALAVGAGVAVVVLTWYLHDVRLSAAIVLSLAIVLSAAVGLFAAAAAFGWVGNFVGIDPVIRPVNTWTWPKLGG